MRPKPKMLHRLSRILRSPQQQRVRARRRPQSQLIHRQALPTRFLDPCSRSRCESQRRDSQLGDGEQTRVVGDCANDDEGLFGAGHGGETGKGHGRAIDAGHEEAAEHDAVEGGGGTACGLGDC